MGTCAVKLWPNSLAEKLVEHDKPLVLEMGIGASGIPHIGSIGDAVRTNFVRVALEEMGVPNKFIAFSDDMDGLRKVPTGFPESLSQYINMPVSLIPDPFGCCESYAGHMSGLLKQGLEMLSIPFDFRSSTDVYGAGELNEEILRLLTNTDLFRKIILQETGSKKDDNWTPFFPICENCHSIYNTLVKEIDLKAGLASYACELSVNGREGCGYSGETSVLNGGGKLPWKADWAARWHAFGVDFESYGSDLADSFRASNRILEEVFGGQSILGMEYQLFLDEEGRKISKSKGGDVLTVQKWLRYASPESLLYLMLKKPRRAKRISTQSIPRHVRAYSSLEKKVASKGSEGISDIQAATYDLVNNCVPSDAPEHSVLPQIYRLACSRKIQDVSTLVSAFKQQNSEYADKDIIVAAQRAINFSQEVGFRARDIPLTFSSPVLESKGEYKTSSEFKEGVPDQYFLRGRLVAKRDFGSLVFFDLRDQTGTVQLMTTKEDSLFRDFKKWSCGDIVSVSGRKCETKVGIPTLSLESGKKETICNAPMPDKLNGVRRDTGIQNRTLDLLANQQQFNWFLRRNEIVTQVRRFLYDNGFQEVDTGILQKVTNTSMAQDFKTHSTFFDRDLYLRKTPELRLKQLMVAGLENIFEMGKNFRNEGVSKEYHPEFTIVELYQSYADYKQVLDLTTRLLLHLDSTVGRPSTNPAVAEHVMMYDFIQQHTNIDARDATIPQLKSLIAQDILKDYGDDEQTRKGFYVYDLFRTILRENEEGNLVLHGVPKEISVLGKPYDEEPSLTEEFRYFVRGNLICNGITELTDYEEQRRRILQQSKTWNKPLDENDQMFLDMLKIGLPPCAGIGLGIEKLLMIYGEMNNIKDVLYFPL